jgi:hypothetical protein
MRDFEAELMDLISDAQDAGLRAMKSHPGLNAALWHSKRKALKAHDGERRA